MYALCELYFWKVYIFFVTQGSKTYIILPIFRGFTSIHNHLSGGNFSSTDLHTFASENNMNMLVVTNS